jgi:1,4-alpha-glucan branching enzyme
MALTCPVKITYHKGAGRFGVSSKEGAMSLQKQYPKTGSNCKVTFSLSKHNAGSALNAHLVGDFNNWDRGANPMRKAKDESFTVTIDLEKNKEYQFRYLLDNDRWENDDAADKYVTNEHGSENSVVVV